MGTCQERIGPVSLCSLNALPGTDRCQRHTDCFRCGASLEGTIAHAAAPVKAGDPPEFACNPCFQSLAAQFPPSPLPRFDDLEAEANSPENKRAITRGERTKAEKEEAALHGAVRTIERLGKP